MLSLNIRFEGVVILNSFTMCFNSLFFINITVMLFIIKELYYCSIFNMVFLCWSIPWYFSRYSDLTHVNAINK